MEIYNSPSLSHQLENFRNELFSKLPSNAAFKKLCQYSEHLLRADSEQAYKATYEETKKYALEYGIKWAPNAIAKRLAALDYIPSERRVA